MTTLRNPRSVASRIGLAMFALTGVTLVGGVIAVFVVALVAPGQMENMWMLWLMNDIPMYGLALPVYCLILHFVPDGPAEHRPQTPGLGIGKYLLFLVFCIGSLYLFSILSQLLVSLVDAFKMQSTQSDLDMLGGGELWVTILFVVLVPAVGEEFMFRYLLRKKLRGAGDKTYILVSGICFGLFHLNVEQMFYAFAIGAALAWLYLRTGRLWMCMLTHGLVNLVGTILVPKLYEVSEVAYLVFLAVIIPATIVIFLLAIRQIQRGLLAPVEPGWPGGPPQAAQPPYGWQPAPQMYGYYGHPYPMPYAPPQYPPYQYPPGAAPGWNGYAPNAPTIGINQNHYNNQYINTAGYPPHSPAPQPSGWPSAQPPASPYTQTFVTQPPATPYTQASAALTPPARQNAPPLAVGVTQAPAPGGGQQKQPWRSGQGIPVSPQPVAGMQPQPVQPPPPQQQWQPPAPQPYGAYPLPMAAPPPLPYYPYPPPAKVPQSVVFGNVGMVLYYVLSGLMILVSLLA